MGKSRRIARHSVQSERAKSQGTGATEGLTPATKGHKPARLAPNPSDASNRLVNPIDTQREPAVRGRPTAASPRANGAINHGPAIKPTRHELDDKHHHQQNGQAPLASVLEPVRKALAAAARGYHMKHDRQRQGQGQRAQGEESTGAPHHGSEQKRPIGKEGDSLEGRGV